MVSILCIVFTHSSHNTIFKVLFHQIWQWYAMEPHCFCCIVREQCWSWVNIHANSYYMHFFENQEHLFLHLQLPVRRTATTLKTTFLCVHVCL